MSEWASLDGGIKRTIQDSGDITAPVKVRRLVTANASQHRFTHQLSAIRNTADIFTQRKVQCASDTRATTQEDIRFYIGNKCKWQQGTFIFSHYHGNDLPRSYQDAYRLVMMYLIRVAKGSLLFKENSIIAISDPPTLWDTKTEHNDVIGPQHFITKFNSIDSYIKIAIIVCAAKKLLNRMREVMQDQEGTLKATEHIIVQLTDHFIHHPPNGLCPKKIALLIARHRIERQDTAMDNATGPGNLPLAHHEITEFT